MRSQIKAHGAGGGGVGLPEMARELFMSLAEAGVDIEVCVAAVGRAKFGAFVHLDYPRTWVLDTALCLLLNTRRRTRHNTKKG